jgi:hypothetical protein
MNARQLIASVLGDAIGELIPGRVLRRRHQNQRGLKMRKLVLGIAVLLGAGAGVNGAFMLASPADWYFAVPGVTTTGPFNQHFVRDIGLVFLFIGMVFLVGVARPRLRLFVWAAPTLWLGGHALFHFWEVVVGICRPSTIARDFPAVTLPAIFGAAVTLWAANDSSATNGEAAG